MSEFGINDKAIDVLKKHGGVDFEIQVVDTKEQYILKPLNIELSIDTLNYVSSHFGCVSEYDIHPIIKIEDFSPKEIENHWERREIYSGQCQSDRNIGIVGHNELTTNTFKLTLLNLEEYPFSKDTLKHYNAIIMYAEGMEEPSIPSEWVICLYLGKDLFKELSNKMSQKIIRKISTKLLFNLYADKEKEFSHDNTAYSIPNCYLGSKYTIGGYISLFEIHGKDIIPHCESRERPSFITDDDTISESNDTDDNYKSF